MSDDIKARLDRTLDDLRPTRKSAVMRSLMPKIQAARLRGSTMKEIWHALHDGGLILSYSNFITYYHRLAKSSDAFVSAIISQPPDQLESGQTTGENLPGLDNSLSVLEKLEEARKKIGQKDYSKVALDHARNKNKP